MVEELNGTAAGVGVTALVTALAVGATMAFKSWEVGSVEAGKSSRKRSAGPRPKPSALRKLVCATRRSFLAVERSSFACDTFTRTL